MQASCNSWQGWLENGHHLPSSVLFSTSLLPQHAAAPPLQGLGMAPGQPPLQGLGMAPGPPLTLEPSPHAKQTLTRAHPHPHQPK